MTSATARPQLSRKVRLRFDRRTGRYMLLYPETGLELNRTATEIACLCNVVDCAFSRAKTCNLRRGPVRLKPRFRVHKQVAAGSSTDTKAHFPNWLRPGCGDG